MQKRSDNEKECIPERGCGCQPTWPCNLEFHCTLKGRLSTARI